MSFLRYPAYKPSGVEWLGEVPEHWGVCPLKSFLSIENGLDHKEVVSDQGWPVFGSGGPFAQANTYLYDGESILLGRKGTIDKPLYYSGRFWAVDTMYWSKVKPGCIGRYVYYSCLGIPFAYYQTSTALPSMTKTCLGGHVTCHPSIQEQQAISTFLDHETAKIDALIAEQQRLIELLQEKRQAVISHAVTKGLNPDAPMKDSGVEWLGEVPVHWEIMDLVKTTLLLQTGPFGSQLGTADYKDEGVAIVNPSNINEGSIDTSSGPFISMNKALELERHKLCKGDLVIARRGEMGRCAVVESGKEEKLCGTGSILVRPPDWMCTEFMAHIIRSEYSRASLSLNSVGSTMENLSAAIVGKLRIPVPPRDEQVQIVEWIRSIGSSYHSLANNSVRAINLLQERRSALISAAVTGQIDVRGLVPEADTA